MIGMIAREPRLLRSGVAWIRSNVDDLADLADCLPEALLHDDALVDELFAGDTDAMSSIYHRRCYVIMDQNPTMYDLRPLTRWVRARFTPHEILQHLSYSGELSFMELADVVAEFGPYLARQAMLMQLAQSPHDEYLDWLDRSDVDEDLVARHVFDVAEVPEFRTEGSQYLLDFLVNRGYLQLFSYERVRFVFGPRVQDAMYMRWQMAFDQDGDEYLRSQGPSQSAHLDWLETVTDEDVLLAHLKDTGILLDDVDLSRLPLNPAILA